MPRFAKETTVPVEKSRAEIEECLRKYGASEFHTGWKVDAAMIAFRYESLFVRFVLPLPKREERRFTHKTDRRYGYEAKRTDLQATKEWEQEIRQRWRALLLGIKAKLEMVECKISTVEQEFMANIVLPNDITLGDWIVSEMMPAITRGEMPKLLGHSPEPEPTSEIIDAEFTMNAAKSTKN